MRYCLYKLKFTTAVHFGTSGSAHSVESSGMTFAADTLFSALCNTAKKTGNLGPLVESVKNRELLFSDSMPWTDDMFFLPKPIVPVMPSPATSDRKKLKDLKYIPAGMYREYLDYLRGNGEFDPDHIPKKFGTEQNVFKAVIGGDDAKPYSVGIFRFFENCGLYGIIGYTDKNKLDSVMRLLGILGDGGIGGKTTAGYGKFTVEETDMDAASPGSGIGAILRMLNAGAAGRHVLLTSSAPDDDELDDVMAEASYLLVRRGGFVYSSDAQVTAKKKTQYFFAAGSVFAGLYRGALFDVGGSTPHPVYRYGIPLFLGVSI